VSDGIFRKGSDMSLISWKLHRLAQTAVVAVAIPLVACAHSASAQTTKTIRLVAPAAPGGVADTLSRLLGDQVSRTQGLTILIENRVGAGGVIAAEAVARAAPDGNTLLMMSSDTLIPPHLRKLSYDLLTSFEPVCDLVNAPTLIAVNAASKYRTLGDLLSAARASPGDLTMASFGPATAFQIGFEMLRRVADVDMTFLPYPGVAPAINALLGDHVTSVFASYSTASEQLNAGKLRALAVAPRTRIERLPDVPTVAESGYKDYEAKFWNGLLAPAKTPKETVSRLAGRFAAAMQVPDVKARLVAQSLYPVGLCGADFAALLQKQYDEFGRVIREANMKAE
jgi:tripartite-type tricarboxylate transporter receptor subunit TctC